MNTDYFDIQEKIVLITGSSRGIGLAFAKGFLNAGCTVVLNDINETQLTQTMQQLKDEGHKAFGYAFNIADEVQVNENIAAITKDVGPIDVLVNNAGIQKRAPLEEMTSSDWRQVLDVNLTSCFLMGKAVAKSMIERKMGKIINITSINAELARQNIAPYCTAKGGLKMLTKSMATEWGKYNINVNAIGPGYTLTELTSPLADDPAFDAWVKSEVPLNRWGRPEDLVGCALFLASPAASYISGQTIYIDGGWQASL